MVRMTNDATGHGAVRTADAPPPELHQGDPTSPGAPWSELVQPHDTTETDTATPEPAPVQEDGAHQVPVQRKRGRAGARLTGWMGHARTALSARSARPADALVRTTDDPGAPTDGQPGAPVHRAEVHRRTAVRTAPTAPPAPAKRRPIRTAPGNVSLGEEWGKLTQHRGPWAAAGLRALVALIVIALVGVVVAPPALSAHDIIQWAQSDSTDAGLGLSHAWAWVTFLALDFAAGVCVLICVYCAIVNTKPGIFVLYVWAFASATAYANYSFGSRPDAPGDAVWFFPVMSVVGPLILHSVLHFLRKRIKGAQGNKRGQRPSFPMADWLPFTGTPQDTYGAWRTGAMLGIETPDAALWAYRAVSLDAGWFRRWFVKGLVRRQQTEAFRARLEDEGLALAIPGLVPAGAFVSLAGAPTEGAPDDTAALPPAPVRSGAPAPAGPRTAPTAAPDAPTTVQQTGAVQGGAPAAPAAPVQGGAPGGTVVNLDVAAYTSARVALVRIFEAYGAGRGSWEELIANVSLSRIEKELSIGKRRSSKAFAHAEDVLPWAEAPDVVKETRSA